MSQWGHLSDSNAQRYKLRADSQFASVPKVTVDKYGVPLVASSSVPTPQVACIIPTPQLEEGSLSPQVSPHSRSSTTPRIPLAELNSTTLSQRLFHSPVQPSSHISATRMSTSPSSISTDMSKSPSDMLQTQLMPDRRQEDRRYHRSTERQLVELQQQVNQLGNMLCAKQLNDSTNHSFIMYQKQIDLLEREKDDAECMLQERESQLLQLKESVSALNAEYLADLKELKVKVKELEELTQDKEEKLLFKDREYRKALKSIQGLNMYISSLPAKEELTEMKISLESRTEELAEISEKNSELLDKNEKLHVQLRETDQRKFDLEVANKELSELNKELKHKVESNERRRYEARNLGEDQVEILLFDKNELKLENEKLRNLCEWKSKKFDDEKKRLETQVKTLGTNLEKANILVQDYASKLRESIAKSTMKDALISEKSDANTTLESQMKRFGAEIQSLKANKESTARLDGHYTRLTRGMAKCIAEIKTLNDLCNQVTCGGDPNMSVLLGVRDVTLASGLKPSRLLNDTKDLTMDEKIDLVKVQLEEISSIQRDVEDLRHSLVEKYAENMADGMTSCITQ